MPANLENSVVPQDWKRSVFLPIPKNAQTTAQLHSSHTLVKYCSKFSKPGFGIVKKAEIDVFLELSCFFHDPADVGNLMSGSSAFSKTSLNIR